MSVDKKMISPHNEWYTENVLVCAHFSSKLAHGTYCLYSITKLYRRLNIKISYLHIFQNLTFSFPRNKIGGLHLITNYRICTPIKTILSHHVTNYRIRIGQFSLMSKYRIFISVHTTVCKHESSINLQCK